MARILLGMSGGVDSTMAAWLLKHDGHEVVGVTLRFHDSPLRAQAIMRAQQTAEQLGIEHHVVDMHEQFKRKVKDETARRFAEGGFFYPCVTCTHELKIPALFEQADAFGCEKVATGHYANITSDTDGFQLLPYQLRVPLDKHKEQTFLLYMLTQEQMARLMFPLFDMVKGETRRDAMRYGLTTLAEVNDGQGEPCFYDRLGYARWLETAAGFKPERGDIVYVGDQRKIGSYIGQYHYERDDSLGEYPIEGFKPLDEDDPESELVPYVHDEELFVIHKDIAGKRILAGTRALAGSEMVQVRDVHWTSIEAPSEKRSCRVRVSYERKALPAQVAVREGRTFVAFNGHVLGVRPGQPIVFYSDSLVLGGGIVVG